ncbi:MULTISPECIES: hypothetical protein [Photorhabdus]|uniref:Uncharacterized protein n=3 Tax=Photorhabdus TaxID=29487 RepID=A0ABX0AVY7_9GAMM|nr:MULTISPECIES: hypothetical protein [Photorhabdus]MCC8373917.1 hypothetical protein [Photorhabdus bodei]MCC8466974.1 hypothetical protein [Photorhabdus bodei]MCT8354562.1 hypothetical protein [Photorhabdus kayaii]MDB6375272.1 hypothetical protein [Photorhabdus bodei]NDL11363.1 hypothetical protein [Photorhabdus kayaii]
MQNMNFLWKPCIKPLQGKLIYRESEYSIDFIDYSEVEVERKTGNQGCTSLTIGTLQIEVGVESGKLLYPWGLYPLQHCESRELIIPTMLPGEIFVYLNNTKLIQGVAMDIPNINLWPAFRDPSTKWICIGDDELIGGITVIQFADNVAMALRNDSLMSLWIKPVSEE